MDDSHARATRQEPRSTNATTGIALGQASRPTRFVAAALPDRQAYDKAVAELVDAGIARDSIAVLQGTVGADAIARGRSKARSWLDLGGEQAYVERYEDAAREGNYVVGVPLPSGSRVLREAVISILKAHGGRAVVSRSLWTYEEPV
jgi:hypothetical protein